jgi:hypothetical protein
LAGGGGGGRIAIYYTSNLFAGAITASSGNGSAGKGGAGTIYLKGANQPYGQVVIDNAGSTGTNTSLGSSGNTSFDLTLQNGATLSSYASGIIHNLVVGSNAWIALPSDSGRGPLTVTGNATIQQGGAIMADAIGYAGGQGVGPGRTLQSAYGTTGGGGGYGGAGGMSGPGAAGGVAYGSIMNPNEFGSGGGAGNGNTTNSAGGAGGGIVGLSVGGTLQLDGRISANGAAGVGEGSGGGGGGSILLVAQTVAGAGAILANGGPGNGLGGGGGGGRIAITNYSNFLFAGTLTAYGGCGSNWGGAGTVYLKPSGAASGRIIVDNGGHVGTNTPISVALTNLNDLSLANGAIAYPLAGILQVSNLVIGSNAALTSVKGQTNVDVVALGAATVQAGGMINLDGFGFGTNSGPGAGVSSNWVGSGAGYGGRGGASSMAAGGPSYGSILHPVDQGSGGGQGYPSGVAGGEGGGAIRLQVGGALTIDGQLSADGHDGLQDNSGGGSGGSIWITANSLAGSGIIEANGGAGEFYQGGGGGGGRIAIYSPFEDFTGEIAAFGGSGYFVGRSGSIFVSGELEAPAVISQSPSGFVSNTVSYVDLVFNQALNPASITTARFTIVTPLGVMPQAYLTVSQLTPEAVRVSFLLQSVEGNYTITAGPQIQNLYGQNMVQSYTGAFTISYPVIQGTVTDTNGVPVPGVVLQNSFGVAVTNDANGTYAEEAAVGYYSPPLTITPSRNGLVFVPSFRAYTNIATSISNQNYLAVPTIAPTMSSQLRPPNFLVNWFGLPGVSYQLFYSLDLMTWEPWGGAVVGTNGPVQVVVPTGTDRAKFFRVQAVN